MASYRESRFGNCPVCGETDGFVNICCNHWYVCHEHKNKWFVGSNLFPNRDFENEYDWAENTKLLDGYNEVEPIKDMQPISVLADKAKAMTCRKLQNMFAHKRILVVDDDPTVRASCIRIFGQRDFHVEVAASAKEGLERTIFGYFDCALIDLKMPDMNGMEVVRTARKNRGNMAILIITGHGTEESAREATRLGVSDYLCKPFTPDELVNAVGHALNRQ